MRTKQGIERLFNFEIRNKLEIRINQKLEISAVHNLFHLEINNT